MATIANILGLVGVLLLLLDFLLLQLGRIRPIGFTYPFLNLLGALLILFSLFYAWNLPAALMEFAWALVSIIGLWRWGKTRPKACSKSAN